MSLNPKKIIHRIGLQFLQLLLSLAVLLNTTCLVFEISRKKNPVKVQQISDQERIKQLERENKELQRANEILRKAAAFFAQAELDRLHK